tara:strand:+ start:342 stop:572 length:231 start_codon:yes stop_codon:yes gene_type:complete
MEYFVQFIEKSAKDKPMDSLGSDGRYKLDGRLGFEQMVRVADKVRVSRAPKVIGYKIIRSKSYRDEGFVVYNSNLK